MAIGTKIAGAEEYKKQPQNVSPFSGSDSTSKMRRPNWPRFLLFTQVTNRYSLFTKRSSYRALLVLPDPQCLCCIAYDCACTVFKLLLLASDVETNPGPSTTELLNGMV